MRRVMGILFSFCFLLLVFTITATAGKVGELVIEHDMVITEDTTWTGKDVTINRGATLRVRHSILTIEEGNIVIGKYAKATIKKSQLLWITGLQNSEVTIDDCKVMDYVKSIKGIIHLINTRVADTLYKDKTLTEGEKLP